MAALTTIRLLAALSFVLSPKINLMVILWKVILWDTRRPKNPEKIKANYSNSLRHRDEIYKKYQH
jgi:hypothetical protein